MLQIGQGKLIPFRLGIIILLTLGISTGCRSGSSPDSPPRVTTAPSPYPFPDFAEMPITDPCRNALWPLDSDASWTYELIGDNATYTVLLEASSLTDGVAVALNGDLSVMTCRGASLIGLPPSILSSGHPALGGDISIINPTGAYLPGDITLTSSANRTPWDLWGEAEGSLTLPAETVRIDEGQIVITGQKQPPLTVSINAGDFTVIPVIQTWFYDLQTVRSDGMRAPFIVSLAVVAYFAEGIGPVRFDFNGGEISSPDTRISLDERWTMELTRYSRSVE